MHDNNAVLETGLKPMNCPAHCLIFKSKQRSHRDLPVRIADFSGLFRNESSGALSGLTRVRQFHQDDGHVFCTQDQIFDEVHKILSFLHKAYTSFGELHVVLRAASIWGGAFLIVHRAHRETGHLVHLMWIDHWKYMENEQLNILLSKAHHAFVQE